jgi:hypothetical protein
MIFSLAPTLKVMEHRKISREERFAQYSLNARFQAFARFAHALSGRILNIFDSLK